MSNWIEHGRPDVVEIEPYSESGPPAVILYEKHQAAISELQSANAILEGYKVEADRECERLRAEVERLEFQLGVKTEFLRTRQCADHSGKWDRGRCLQCEKETAEGECKQLKAEVGRLQNGMDVLAANAEAAQKRSQYWKDNHLAGNKHIEALEAKLRAVEGLAIEALEWLEMPGNAVEERNLAKRLRTELEAKLESKP